MSTRTLIFSLAMLLVGSHAGIMAQDIIVPTGSACRHLTEPSGAREDNIGGNTITGAEIGLANNVDNFGVYEFEDLSAIAGMAVSGATLNINPATGYTSNFHGSDLDTQSAGLLCFCRKFPRHRSERSCKRLASDQ